MIIVWILSNIIDRNSFIHSFNLLFISDKQTVLVAGKLTQVVFGHWDVVTCLARSESYIGGDCYILSGSRDATLLLWYWNGKSNGIGDNPNSKSFPTVCYWFNVSYR